MAIFRVSSQGHVERMPDAKTTTFVLRVVMIEGDVMAGLDFTAYCTHHPFTVTIRRVTEDGSNLLLDCETAWPVYENFFDDVVVNSAGVARRDQFFYDHEKNSYPIYVSHPT